MFASIILASMLCTSTPSGADKCEVAYDHTWSNTSIVQTLESFKKDGIDCLTKLEHYPDVETIDKNHYRVAGCYTVNYQARPGFGILENMLDPNDTFIRPEKDLVVKL